MRILVFIVSVLVVGYVDFGIAIVDCFIIVVMTDRQTDRQAGSLRWE